MTYIELRTPLEIGSAIRMLRRGHGLSQAQLAQKVGVSRLWVNQLEHGKGGASLELVLRTFSALGSPLLFEDAEGTATVHMPGGDDVPQTSFIDEVLRRSRQRTPD